VIQDRQMVDKNYDRDVRVKATSIPASRKMDEAYKQMENGNAPQAQAANNEAINMLQALGYIDGGDDLKQQEARYRQNLKVMNQPPPAESAPAKDFLKKQKEEERSNQQSDSAH